MRMSEKVYILVMLKLTTFLCFLVSQLFITWFGWFLGKVPARGAVFGLRYDSPMIALLIALCAFLWVPVTINLLYGLGFQWGNRAFGSFLVVIALWIAAGPVAALLFNAVVVGEKLDLPLVAGLVCITVGAILVATHGEVAHMLS